MPRCIIGAVTMKMISSTSITSTSGTTLISASDVDDAAAAADRAGDAAAAGLNFRHLREVPLGDVQELHREVVHLRREQLHAIRQVVVEAAPRGSPRPGRPRSRSAPRRCRARRPPRLVEPVWPMLWNAIMMPHTVPNSPMNGAMLAVVARNGHALLELVDLDDRRAQQRAVDGRQALQSWTSGGRLRIGPSPSSRRGLAQLRGQLGVAGLKEPDQRAVAERAADRLDFGELAAAAEDVENCARLPRGAPERPPACRG